MSKGLSQRLTLVDYTSVKTKRGERNRGIVHGVRCRAIKLSLASKLAITVSCCVYISTGCVIRI